MSKPIDSIDEIKPNSQPDALGKEAGKGISWLTLSLASGRGFSFIAQLILGYLLLDEDFGVFALAMSVASFIQCFRDGGVQKVLVQQGKTNYERLKGPAFWIGFWFSTTAGLGLVGAAPWAARFYAEPELTKLLWVVAVSLPMSMPAKMLTAKLQIDLQFKTIAKISVASMFLRHASVILFAYLGLRALSFVLPLLLVATFEGIAGFLATRSIPWKSGHQLRLWPELLGNSLWETINAFLRGFANNGDYLVLGTLINKGTLGQYFFGYQLTVQMHTLLVVGFNQVLFPILTRLQDEPERMAQALVRSLRAFVLASCALSIPIAVGIAPLEELVWRGKWEPAVPLMQIFAILVPLRGVSGIVHSAVAARGQFRLAASITAIQGAILMLSAGLSYLFFGASITKIALGVSIVQIVLSNTLAMAVLRSYGVSLSAVPLAVAPSFFAGFTAAVPSFLLDLRLSESIAPWLRLSIALTCYVLTFVIITRVFMRQHLREVLDIAPARLAQPIRSLLKLGNPNRVDG